MSINGNLPAILVLQVCVGLVACSSSDGTLTGSLGGSGPLGGTAPSGGGNAGGATYAGGTTNAGGSGAAAVRGGAANGGAATGSSGNGSGGSLASSGGAVGQGGAASGGASYGGNAAGGLVVKGGAANGGAANGGAGVGGAATGGSSGAASGGSSATGGATTALGGGSSIAGAPAENHWVGTWTASPYYDSGNQPPTSLANGVLRQIAHVSLGGQQLRVQFSNLSGNGPVTINAAHVALCKATPAVDSTIDPATDKALAFSGSAAVTIPQGKEIWSDPVDFSVPAQGNVTVTTAFGSVPSNVVGHSGSRTTSYIQAGSTNVSAASMTTATTTDHWYYLSGIDVMADAAAKGTVAIGDSITDGRGTDTNRNNRWTDVLAARLHANAATANVSVMNQGIGATNLVGASGTAAQARFNRDVLGQSGVKYVIVYDGVNDIGGGASFASMKTAYDDLISRAHAKGLLVYGATILPFGANSYYSAAHESVRQQVNTYIKSGAFDGYIDFDAALTDGGNPPKLQTTYATWAQTDGLHPGPAGYQKMGESVDLTLFTK